jgi:K+-transporting ATPase ATPase B chain
VPFTAQTRMSGVDSAAARHPQGRGRRRAPLRRGAGPAVPAEVARGGRHRAAAARRWWWPTARVLGVIELKDIVKGGIKERFAELRRMGIKTVMITGDNR